MFFPVPYAYYDPNIVYRQTKIPDVVPIHKDTGHWDQGERQMACFDNKDYKDMRMNSDDFLKEQKSQERALMQVKSFFWSYINLLYFLLVGSAHYSEHLWPMSENWPPRLERFLEIFAQSYHCRAYYSGVEE